MFRCCRSNDLGTWRSGVGAILASVALGGVLVLIADLLGRAPEGESVLSQWVTSFSMMLLPLWVGLGAAEGRRRRCGARDADPFRHESQ